MAVTSVASSGGKQACWLLGKRPARIPAVLGVGIQIGVHYCVLSGLPAGASGALSAWVPGSFSDTSWALGLERKELLFGRQDSC